jgi:hypothetical protein
MAAYQVVRDFNKNALHFFAFSLSSTDVSARWARAREKAIGLAGESHRLLPLYLGMWGPWPTLWIKMYMR